MTRDRWTERAEAGRVAHAAQGGHRRQLRDGQRLQPIRATGWPCSTPPPARQLPMPVNSLIRNGRRERRRSLSLEATADGFYGSGLRLQPNAGKPRGHLQGRLGRQPGLGRGLPRRHLLGLPGRRRGLCRRAPALLRQRRRIPADRAELDLPARHRLHRRCPRHDQSRTRSATSTTRPAASGAAQLVPRHQRRDLHRPEPGAVERQRQRRLHRLRAASSPGSTARPSRAWCGSPGHPAAPDDDGPRLAGSNFLPTATQLRPGRADQLAGQLRPGQRTAHLPVDPGRRHGHPDLHHHRAVHVLAAALPRLPGHRRPPGSSHTLPGSGHRPEGQCGRRRDHLGHRDRRAVAERVRPGGAAATGRSPTGPSTRPRGTTAADVSNDFTGTRGSGVTTGVPGAIAGHAGTAYRFDGTSTGRSTSRSAPPGWLRRSSASRPGSRPPPSPAASSSASATRPAATPPRTTGTST